MSYGQPVIFIDTLTDRPAIGSMPKEYRDVCNILIDQGWIFVDGGSKAKHKIIPPGGKKRRPLGVPRTPSSHGSFLALVSKARQYGAKIDMKGNSTAETVRPSTETPAMITAVESDILPISTHGAWWRSDAAQPELPLPEPIPEPVVERRYAPRPLTPVKPVVDPYAKGDKGWSLTQAMTMLRQGYHVNKVIAKTGFGPAWFKDMTDATGFGIPGS